MIRPVVSVIVNISEGDFFKAVFRKSRKNRVVFSNKIRWNKFELSNALEAFRIVHEWMMSSFHIIVIL